MLRKQVRQTREKRKETCIQRRNQETQREEKCTRDVQVYDVFKSRKFVRVTKNGLIDPVNSQ